tara:strand:- start:4829 stop:5521 length:693 start_codon:yes stop_codon:yes gene_type:complete
MGHNNQCKTAILIFANSSKEEVKHKLFAKDYKLFDTLTSLTYKSVKKSKLPYYHYSEKQQEGNTFGERFTNAIQSVFDKGYENVITIGNDTPKLKASHLIEAEHQLKNNKTVIGPSVDGGFYLMGINKLQFNAKQFYNLPWQTSNLRKSLLNFIASNQSKVVSFLPVLRDIDSIQDIKKLVNHAFILPKKLLVVFFLILNNSLNCYKHILLFFLSNFSSIIYNKGSPVLQ